MKKVSHNYPGYYAPSGCSYIGNLRQAHVFSRNGLLRYSVEIVRRVELFKNGKPRRVVTLT